MKKHLPEAAAVLPVGLAAVCLFQIASLRGEIGSLAFQSQQSDFPSGFLSTGDLLHCRQPVGTGRQPFGWEGVPV